MTSPHQSAGLPGLAGKAILITGGGSGLGAALCRALAAAGARIMVADQDPARAAATLDSLTPPADDPPHGMLVFDVGDPDAAQQAIDTFGERYGRIDVLINNAGTDVTCAIDDLSQTDWERVLRTNLSGPFQLVRAALPYMKRQGSGQIVNIASTAAKRAWPNASAYHASKWGLLAFLPSFIFILAGGPLVESTHGKLHFTAPLTAITAAVVGVIASLALFFIAHIAYPTNTGGTFPYNPDWAALLLALAAGVALIRFKVGVIPVIVLCALAGWALKVFL